MTLMVARIVTGFVALAHFGFMWLEMAAWTKPLGRKIFRNSEAFAKESAGLAANQGLYNGFLASGLVWSLISPNAIVGYQVAVFFLSCVVVAGAYGAYSVSRRILYIQALPALIALTLTLVGGVLIT